MGKAAKRKAGRYGLINPKKKRAPVLDLLPLDKLEIYPCAFFLEEFTFEQLKEALEEYLSIHNFKWSGSASPQLKEVASEIEFTHPDYPVDMADALSTMAFASWLKDKPKTEESARKFSQTVCSIAKGMYYLYRYSKKPFAKVEDAFESAIELHNCSKLLLVLGIPSTEENYFYRGNPYNR